MVCRAADDVRDSKTIKKDKQEIFELSPNINRYKKITRLVQLVCIIWILCFKITQCFVNTVQISFTSSLLTLKEPAKKQTNKQTIVCLSCPLHVPASEL